MNYGTAKAAIWALTLLTLSAAPVWAIGKIDPDTTAIRGLGQAWIEYYKAGNYEAIPQLYTEDALIMARGRPRLEGREAIRKSLGGLAAGRKVDIVITERELTVAGNFAWSVSDFKVSYTPKEANSKPHIEFGRSLIVYRKDKDGRWRIHRDMDSPAPPPGPGPAPTSDK